MNILKEEQIREQAVFDIACKMAAAARTAPKGRGVDNIEIAILKKEEIKLVSDRLKQMANEKELPAFFLRDAENILSAQAMLIMGTKVSALGLNPCGLCGFGNCESKPATAPCAFNTGDLGIAVGSAVSIATDNRIDNRIMYTVGLAITDLKLLGDEVKIAYGIPLSISSKNPFFDRK